MPEFCPDKLAIFPEKMAKVFKAATEEIIDDSYPVSVELSLTDRCNFHCVWCSDGPLRERLNGHMAKEPLFALLQDLSKGGTKGITIEGGGEPTLHPLINDTIQYIRELGMAAGLITNGARFNFRETFNDLEWVRVSLDASMPSHMDFFKKRGAFNIVMRNIEEMAKIRLNTLIGISYIVTNQNLEGISKIVENLREIGVDYIQMKPVIDHPNLLCGPEDIFRLNHLKQYETAQFRLFLDALYENQIKGNGGQGCVANSVTTTVTANGDVYFCGRLNTDLTWPPMGNINYQSFHDIWTNEERRKQSNLMRQASECFSRCPECRLTKFNLAINEIIRGDREPFITLLIVKTPNFI